MRNAVVGWPLWGLLTAGPLAGCAGTGWSDLATVSAVSADREYAGAVTVYLGQEGRQALTRGVAARAPKLFAAHSAAVLEPSTVSVDGAQLVQIGPGSSLPLRVVGLDVLLPPELPEPRVRLKLLLEEVRIPLVGLGSACEFSVPTQTANVDVAFELSRDLSGRLRAVPREPVGDTGNEILTRSMGCGVFPSGSKDEVARLVLRALTAHFVHDAAAVAAVGQAAAEASGSLLLGASITPFVDGSRLDVRLLSRAPVPSGSPPAIYAEGFTAIPLTVAVGVTPSSCSGGRPPDWPPATPAPAYTPDVNGDGHAWSMVLRRDALTAVTRAALSTGLWCGAGLIPMGSVGNWRDALTLPPALPDAAPLWGRLVAPGPWTVGPPEAGQATFNLSAADAHLEVLVGLRGVEVAVIRFDGALQLDKLALQMRPGGEVGLDGGVVSLAEAPPGLATFAGELLEMLTQGFSLLRLPAELAELAGPMSVQATPEAIVLSGALAPLTASATLGAALSVVPTAPASGCGATQGGPPSASAAVALGLLLLAGLRRRRGPMLKPSQNQALATTRGPFARSAARR